MEVDPVRLVMQILADALTVPVSSEIPPERQVRCVSVSLSGGDVTGLIMRPRLDLMCWGATDREAFSIAMAAVEALQEAALDHDLLSSCELESLSRDQWSRMGQSRYLAVVFLTINT
jgi:hypothetical protein